MRYVTFYEEYPIYEPAEGGYYYAGLQVSEYERLSKRKAKALFKEIWAECQKENKEEMESRRPHEKRNSYDLWYKSFDGQEIWKTSKYIGEGMRYVIERKLGSKTRGWVPYC